MGKIKNYYITDGKRFIWKNNRGKYTVTHGEMMADRYTLAEAESIFNNQLPKWMRTAFRVEKIVSADTKEVKALSKSDIHKNTEKVMDMEYVSKWLERLESLNGLAEEASTRRERLRGEQSLVDGQIQDELHYIEFAKCNAYQAWVSWKRLQILRQQRRSIKNELEVLDIILEKKVGQVVAEDIRKQIEGMDHRMYTPRSQVELYDI